MIKKLRFASCAFAAALIVLATVLMLDIEKARAQVAVDPADLTVALLRVNLSAKALTAAGLSPTQAAATVNDVESYLSEHASALTTADSAFASALRERDRLQRLIQSGSHTANDLSAYATALTTYDSAHSQRNTVLNNIWNAGVADLSEAQENILAQLRVNSTWDVPVEFQTVSRTEPQWVELRDALANERISAAYGQSVDPDAAALLAQLRADPTVSAAIANLAANLPAVTSSWNTAVND